jgi:phosphatidylglycerophosphatase A
MSFSKWIATAFGLGFFPKAPGTVAAIASCLVFALLHQISTGAWVIYTLLMLIFIAGIMSSSHVEKEWGKDNNKVVIDEVLGMGIALLFIPYKIQYFLAGFILFRIFDIWKPFYIRKLEKINGGLGVMLDDVLAGIYSNIVLQGIIYFK